MVLCRKSRKCEARKTARKDKRGDERNTLIEAWNQENSIYLRYAHTARWYSYLCKLWVRINVSYSGVSPLMERMMVRISSVVFANGKHWHCTLYIAHCLHLHFPYTPSCYGLRPFFYTFLLVTFGLRLRRSILNVVGIAAISYRKYLPRSEWLCG